jgi:hypothetical protein
MTHPILERTAANVIGAPVVVPLRKSIVTSSPPTKETTVIAEPYRRRPPIRFPGARLTMSAPTTQNIPNATTNGACPANDSPLWKTRIDP